MAPASALAAAGAGAACIRALFLVVVEAPIAVVLILMTPKPIEREGNGVFRLLGAAEGFQHVLAMLRAAATESARGLEAA